MPGFIDKWQDARRARKGKKIKKGVVIGNTTAGQNLGRQAVLDEAMKILHEELPQARDAADSAYVNVYLTRSLEELSDAKEEMMSEGEPPDFAIFFGGDGTTQKTLGEDPEFLRFLKSNLDNSCEVVIFGTGTQRVVPRALKLLGGGSDPASQLARFRTVCQKYARGIPRDIVCCPILKINERHGFIYGSGLIVNALDEYYRIEAGPSRQFKAGLGTLWRETFGRLNPWRRPSVFRRFDAQVSWRGSDGSERHAAMTRMNALIASSLREVNPWLKVTHRTGERLGCFHGLALDNGFTRTVLNVPAMIVGAPMLGDVQDMVTDRLVVRYSDPDTRHTIDGEMYEMGQLGGPGDGSVVIETGPFIKLVVG